MTVDLDALEALAKAAIINDDPEDWPLEGAVGWDRPEDNKLVAALTPGTVLALIAELRQERERADAAEKKLEMPCGSCHPCTEWANQTWVNAGLRLPHVIDWQEMTAALSRAEETIEAVEDLVTRHYLDTHMGEKVLEILDTYDENGSARV